MSTQQGFEERSGEAFEFDERLTVIGRLLQPGQKAPDFVLDAFDPMRQTMRTVRLADTAGRVRLLNVVNSLDTPVCQVETRRWEQLRAELSADVRVYTVSMDLPFALARWQSAEHVEHELLSSHRSEQYGRDYGVLIKSGACSNAQSLSSIATASSRTRSMSPTRCVSRTMRSRRRRSWAAA